jgi:hypothetical protein
MPPLTTVTCLFISQDGRLSVQLMPRPVPETYEIVTAPPGMMHACAVLGIPPIRTFRRTVDGGIPVFEE